MTEHKKRIYAPLISHLKEFDQLVNSLKEAYKQYKSYQKQNLTEEEKSRAFVVLVQMMAIESAMNSVSMDSKYWHRKLPKAKVNTLREVRVMLNKSKRAANEVISTKPTLSKPKNYKRKLAEEQRLLASA